MSRLPEPTYDSGPVRIPTASLKEGHAKKVLYVSRDGSTQELVLCRVGGRLHAADSACPHQGGRLAEGPMMEGRYYHCPLHLYRFHPASGESVEIPCDPVTTFRVTVEGSDALVWVHERATSVTPYSVSHFPPPAAGGGK